MGNPGLEAVPNSASPSPAEPFGKRVKRLREEQGILASHAAYLCGVTEGAIRQIESGQTKSASLHVGIRLAALLHVEPRYLAFGEGTEPTRKR
jgi:transcriptional regulator with XRE-family HTH domain